MGNRSFFILVPVMLALLVGASSLYVVKQTERAVKLRFQEVVLADIKPGLHIKIPFIEEVRKFDGRVLTLELRSERYLTVEKKNMIVDSYAKWRVVDVNKYYTATSGLESQAKSLLSSRVDEGLRNQFGERTLHEVVSGQRDELMAVLKQDLNSIALSELGIEVVDVRVKRIDLPDEVGGSVFSRMSTEREREAREHRSKGQEQAEFIRADADKQQAVIEAQAFKEAEQLRGSGDAEASAIYAAAYNQDPEFYRFVRSLNAYKLSFQNKGDMLLVDPDSDFFRYLKDSQGKK